MPYLLSCINSYFINYNLYLVFKLYQHSKQCKINMKKKLLSYTLYKMMGLIYFPSPQNKLQYHLFL